MTFLYFIAGLSFLIFFHELGHFTFAKIFRVYVYEFALFMGPKIFQIKGKETRYSLRCLPIGGYCSMAGEQDAPGKRNAEEARDEERPEVPFERTIDGVARWKRLIIMFAGPLFNFLICFVLLIVYFAGVGKAEPLSKINVVEDGIFAAAGFKTGDVITGIKASLSDGKIVENYEISTWEDIQKILNEANPSLDDVSAVGKTQCLDVTYVRDGKTFVKNDVCRTFTTYHSNDGVNVEIQPLFGFGQTSVKMNAPEILSSAGALEVKMAGLIFEALADTFKPGGLKNVAGPVGMYRSAVVFADQGFFSFIFFLAMISVNLGAVNLLPLPALDGGQMLLVIIDALMGKRHRLSKKAQGVINGVGFIILIVFILLITIKDIFF